MIVSAIVAHAHKRVIGVGINLPWHLPAEMRHFMRTTKNHHVIMGRKTYNSMGKPLKHRVNIVVTRDPFFVASGVLVAHSIEEALTMAKENGENEAFIIGGGQIYTSSLPFLDKLYLTEIDLQVPDGDIFFPEVNFSHWSLDSEESHLPDEKNKYPFKIKVYVKKK
jgi:dihydrofolate reductase